MDTLLLTNNDWDLVLDASGNIALAKSPYATAQDVASAIRLFIGECWYDTTRGVPYFADILGRQPPAQLLKARFIAAALTVPEVASAVCFLSGITNRRLEGQVQFKTTAGVSGAVALSATPGDGSVFILGQSSLGGLNVI